ncbi:hypothetical protein K3495_g10665 [Podosphaera aphanis]|nr:hypothetical protein K3495_g10665 [Podosphaera aphanis]
MGAPGEFPDSSLSKDLEQPKETDFGSVDHHSIKSLQQATDENFAAIDRRVDRFEKKMESNFDVMMKQFVKLTIELRGENTAKNDKCDQKQQKLNDKAEFSKGKQKALDQSTVIQKPENPASSSNIGTSDQARLPNGKLNLFRNIDPYQGEMTDQERYVKDIWPEAKLESEIYYTHSDGCSNRNKVNFKPEWKLSKASNDVFTKLRHI